MKPKDNGLANLHDRKREERGFCCMQLIIFLTDNGVKSWDEWLTRPASTDCVRCRFKSSCPVMSAKRILLLIFHPPEGLHPGNRQQTRENHREDHGPRPAPFCFSSPAGNFRSL